MMQARVADAARPDVLLAGHRWDGAPTRSIVLLHAGVCDSRSWHLVAPELTDLATVWAYDRPGAGDTPPTPGIRDHVGDAIAFLDANVRGPAWLVAGSMGGAVALDVALSHPDRIAGLVLIGSAVTGSPETAATESEQRLIDRIDEAVQTGDLDEANRFEVWYWLDGPAQAEARVSGTQRVLALEMNRSILEAGRTAGGESGFDESIDAWHRLAEISCPVTIAVGDYDESGVIASAHHLSNAISGARFTALAETAHLPYLDSPEQVVATIRTALLSAD
jgi:pimeloyl-ACP methyl ester carboxylesterase